MAALPSNLEKYYSTHYGVLELVSHLIQHPNDDYELGVGDGKAIIPNIKVRDLVDEFQKNKLPEGDKIDISKANNALFRALYARLLSLGPEKQTTIPDKETRDSILRAYHEHLKEIESETKSPRIKIPQLRDQIRSAINHSRLQQTIEDRVEQALSPFTQGSSSSGLYIKQMLPELKNELASKLYNIDTSDPIKAQAQIEAIIEVGISRSATWRTLENTLVSEGQSTAPITKNLSKILSQEKINKAEGEVDRKNISNLNTTYRPSPTESRNQLRDSVNRWQKKSNISSNNSTQLGEELAEALRESTYAVIAEPNIIEIFDKKQDYVTKSVVRALNSDRLRQYNLTQVDRDRLVELAIKDPNTANYVANLASGLEPPNTDLLYYIGLRPQPLVNYITKQAGVDPLVVKFSRAGYSTEEILKELQRSGYSQSDATAQLTSFQNFLASNTGLVGSIYKSRLSYDRAILKIKNALLPQNIPIIRNIYGVYSNIQSGITKAYSAFLGQHETLAIILSNQHRLAAWAGWITGLTKSNNVPQWIRTGLTFYKNGGFTFEGFKDSLKTHYRIKFGQWLIGQGAKIGGEKMFGKFLAWAGGSLVAGTATGGVGFAIQAGLWFMQQAKKAPEAIKNADLAAGWMLQNLAGLMAMLSVAGPTLIGAVIGLVGGVISIFVFGLTAPWWLVVGGFTLGGMALGYLYSQLGAIGAWASAGLSAFGASLAAWAQGVFGSLGTVAGTFGLIIPGTILGTVLAMSLGIDANITAKIETKIGEDDFPTAFECEASEVPKPEPGQVLFSDDGKYAFPVSGFTDYGCAHWDGDLVVDIFTGQANYLDPQKNLPVVAYTSGVINMLVTDDDLGGNYLILAGDDKRFYYYAHNCTMYVTDGQRVSVGEVIATTNQSGKNAKVTPEHSHFGISSTNEFYDGGTVCPQRDFAEKFSSLKNRCTQASLCAPPTKE